VLQLRDRGCAFPAYTHNRFLHGRHVQHWQRGGETSMDNLILLCTHHHHLVHERKPLND
jgi:5-methylcytosine-specific restriction endonuclease McrA